MAASGKKRAATGKGGKTGRPRKAAARQEMPQDQEPDFIRAEVLILLSFAAAILLFLSNFHLCGVVGDFLRTLQLGIFGAVGYVAPLLLFVGTCFYLSNRGNGAAMRKLAASVAAVLVISGFLQMFFGGRLDAGIMEYYHQASENGLGGGLVGGALYGGLVSVLGSVGAFLVLLVLFIICAVCITERSFVKAVKKGSDVAYQHAREDMNRRREIHAERQEERRRLREERVRGVNLDSTDLSQAGEPDDAEEFEAEEKYGAGEYKAEEYKVEEAAPVPAAAVQKTVSQADVFRGTITMPSLYEEDEDEVPFEPDESLSPAESAQRLVEEGTRSYLGRAPELDGAGTYSVEPVTVLPGAAAYPAEQETGTGKEQAGEQDREPVQVWDRERSQVQDQKGDPSQDQSRDQDQNWNRSQDQGLEQDSPVRRPVVEIYREEPVEEIDMEPKASSAEKDIWQETAEEQEAQEAGTYVETYTTDGSEQGVNYDSFFIPEEPKRVVTASGKVIETDTEALQKKLESRRREAKEAAAEAGSEASVQQQIQEKEQQPKKQYVFPPLSLLKKGGRASGSGSEEEYKETAIKLQQTLRNFGVGVTVTNISCGPSVTRYELHPEQGVKVSKIVSLTDDIKLSLAAADIRIEAPIPGKSAVGIEVPNKEKSAVYLRDLLESEAFQNHSSRLAFAVGKDIGGQVVVTDIAKMPHLLIAGATGSGKSVCINTLIMSIIFKSDPEDVKMIMVDPKVVELSVYNGIPHLLIPVVTDPKKASGALNWAVAEMTDRYKKFAEYNVRDLKGYNARVENIRDIDDEKKPKKMPQIVIIVDELADLMMVAPGEVEDAICRLAQLARAAGIHLVIATQRPSVNVITGLIKANVPSRIAFSVASGVDSRTIIDMVGAEKLLGKGDMLFYPSGIPKPLRVQGAFVSDSEVQQVVEFLTEQGMTADYDPNVERQMNAGAAAAVQPGGGNGGSGRDEYFEQAGRFIIEKEKASIGMLQRMFKIGFNRAARIMDQLAEAGVVGDEEGTKPRRILMTMEEFESFLRDGQ